MEELNQTERLIYKLYISRIQNYRTMKNITDKTAPIVDEGTPPQQQYLLEYLTINGIQSIDQISKELRRARPSITQILQRMANNCLVRRVKHPGDRKVYYEVSPGIRNKMKIHSRISMARTLFDAFTPDEIEQFLRMETKFGESLHAKLALDDSSFARLIPEALTITDGPYQPLS